MEHNTKNGKFWGQDWRIWGTQDGSIWSEAESVQAIEMYQAGYDWKEMEPYMGRPWTAIRAQIYKLRSGKRSEAALAIIDLSFRKNRKKENPE